MGKDAGKLDLESKKQRWKEFTKWQTKRRWLMKNIGKMNPKKRQREQRCGRYSLKINLRGKQNMEIRKTKSKQQTNKQTNKQTKHRENRSVFLSSWWSELIVLMLGILILILHESHAYLLYLSVYSSGIVAFHDPNFGRCLKTSKFGWSLGIFCLPESPCNIDKPD